MSANYEKLKALLRELFQMDQADLDFGLYRIMNAKRDEIERFLEHDLLPQVKTELARHTGLDSGAKKAELDEAIENAKKLGFDPDAAPRVMALRDELKHGTDLDALENEVFSHLCNFFRRYYHQGDFLSLRRYKEGVYAIPYEGEEVKLYWANHDQYYIKSTEYLRNYTFKLRDGRRVHFKVVEAEADVDNNKPQTGKERRFSLVEADSVVVENGELFIRFNYQTDTRKQAELNAAAVSAVLGNTSLTDWLSALGESRPTEKDKQRTLLAKHLDDFTARYAFDYFIHKDLGGFFRRELDFFIKNEIMHLDDVEDEAVPKVQLYLSKIKALRKIAHKVIAFLEQLENFQKRMWLKKKFVVETNYCVTLDRVPEELYPQIIENKEQIKEWKRLYAIQDIERSTVNPGYADSLSVGFLKANPYLVLDTALFTADFKDRLLASDVARGKAATLDDATDGLLVNGDNFHALSLIQARYQAKVSCIYIDPPYNTGTDGFPYKDTYQHSSWITMLYDRVRAGIRLLTPDSLFYVSIDRDEHWNLEPLLFHIFGKENFVEDIIWQKAYGGGSKTKLINNLHEYIACFSRDKAALPALMLPPDPKSLKYYKFQDSKVAVRGKYRTQPLYTNSNDYRENLTYPIPCPSASPGTQSWEDGCGEIRRMLAEDRLLLRGRVGNWAYVLVGQDGTEKPWEGTLIFPPKQWQWEWTTTREAIIKDELVMERDETGNWVVNYKQYRFDESGHERGKKPGSIRVGPYTQTGTSEIDDLFGCEAVKFPKPTGLISELIGVDFMRSRLVVADYFAGSGTTGHAVITLNRQDGRKRQYLLVEMGDQFDAVLRPRIKRLAYSPDWKAGKPSTRDKGISHCFKYLRLESYEDCLNNLELKRAKAQDDLLTRAKDFREDYTLRYMLDVEARGSASLLNVQKFTDPFSYKLKVSTGTVGETREVNVDLVETFNWLVGLTVKHMDHIRGVRVVEGTNPQGDRVLILWRNVAEVPSDKLDEWFKTQGYNTRDQEYDLIYVNGDNNLENLRRGDQTWKVRLIEEDFHRLMWECQDV